MPWRALLFLILCALATQLLLPFLITPRLPHVSKDINQEPSSHQDGSALCFIVRTYWAHGESGSLEKFLGQLVTSPHQSWEALIVVMDQRPFEGLDSLLGRMGDARIRVYAHNIGPQYQAKLPDGNWNPDYHDRLYLLTDKAIYSCKEDTRWVAVTNGDNAYDSAFIPRLVNTPHHVDIVALDFYSRYQRVTASPCERFAAEPGAPPCKENLMRFCNADLAAVIYRWARFVAEERGFSKMDSHGLGLNDGLLADLLKSSGWEVLRITDACLLSHTPSPQLCALEGGVWDDSVLATIQHSGGRCLTREEAKELLLSDPGLEVLDVSVSHDGKTFGFTRGRHVQLSCIRRIPTGPWMNNMYPDECKAPMDGGFGWD